MTVRLARTSRGEPRAPTVAGPLRRWAPAVAAAGLVAIGVLMRFRAPGGLWLDEAQSVAIAREPPITGLVDALRRDGSPPLYYLLLHAWMALFGSSDAAVRALSGVLSVAALPLAWLTGRRLAGRWAGAAALLIVATNPWMIRYATETRMYSLLVLLVLVGLLALDALHRRPALLRAAGVAAATAGLVLTHYWSFFLVAVAGAGLTWHAVRHRRRWSGYAAAAISGGALLFLPWLPTFLFQLAHTGTPWAYRPNGWDLLEIPREWAGRSLPLTLALCVLLLLGSGISVAGGALIARWRTKRGRACPTANRPRPAALGSGAITATVVAVMLIAWAAATAGVGALSSRYTAVVVPLALLSAGAGTAVLRRPHWYLMVAMVAGLGLIAAVRVTDVPRTQAPEVAQVLAAAARPGDVVAFCPDQLGPSVARELAGTGVSGLRLLTYPSGAPPQRVDWVDYAARNMRADPARFAAHLHTLAGPGGQLFLVQAPHPYRTLDSACTDLARMLNVHRGGHRVLVGPDGVAFEQMRLLSWPGRITA